MKTQPAVVTAFVHNDLALVALLDDRFKDYAAIKQRMSAPLFSAKPQPTVLGISSNAIANANGSLVDLLHLGDAVEVEWDPDSNRVRHVKLSGTPSSLVSHAQHDYLGA